MLFYIGKSEENRRHTRCKFNIKKKTFFMGSFFKTKKFYLLIKILKSKLMHSFMFYENFLRIFWKKWHNRKRYRWTWSDFGRTSKVLRLVCESAMTDLLRGHEYVRLDLEAQGDHVHRSRLAGGVSSLDDPVTCPSHTSGWIAYGLV